MIMRKFKPHLLHTCNKYDAQFKLTQEVSSKTNFYILSFTLVTFDRDHWKQDPV